MVKSKLKYWLCLISMMSAVFSSFQAYAASESAGSEESWPAEHKADTAPVDKGFDNDTGTALNEEDLKFYYDKTVINIPKENKRTVMRLKGAHWEADATDGQGRVLSRNAFVWKGGSAIFDKNGNMSDLFLDKAGRTIKGVSIGSPISAIKQLYPPNYTTQPDKFGELYIFEFNAYGKARSLIFVTKSTTGKVTSIILRTQ